VLLRERINKEILPALSKKYKVPVLGLPKITKMTINTGIGRISENKEMVKTVERELTQISGQKPSLTKAKKSIAGFKIREGQAIGMVVTLRGAKMWDFIEKLLMVAFPRKRDFEGLDKKIIAKSGGFTIGIREQLIFPEIRTDDVKDPWGMSLTYTVKNTSNKEAVEEYLKEIGFIFKS